MPTGTRNLRRLLAALLLGSCLVALGQSPAAAVCDCAVESTEAAARNATDVFTGRVTGAESEPKGGGQRGTVYTHEVAVQLVYKGRIREATVEVVTEQVRGSCGLGRLPNGKRYAFFARGDDATLRAGGCSGTRPPGKTLIGELEELYGEGHEPRAEPAAAEAEFTRVEATADEPTELARLAAPGLALVLVGLLGLVLVRRLDRRG